MTSLLNVSFKEDDSFSYTYFDNYNDDCNCMWRKNPNLESVYTIERVDISPRFRRKGLARKLLDNTIEHIKGECPKACIEITAEPDKDSGLTVQNLVDFYESLGFEKYQHFSYRVHLRLYLDDSVKPEPMYDSPDYFKFPLLK